MGILDSNYFKDDSKLLWFGIVSALILLTVMTIVAFVLLNKYCGKKCPVCNTTPSEMLPTEVEMTSTEMRLSEEKPSPEEMKKSSIISESKNPMAYNQLPTSKTETVPMSVTKTESIPPETVNTIPIKSPQNTNFIPTTAVPSSEKMGDVLMEKIIKK